ncbi:MAG TPA: hypothetical protein VJ793_27075 [Anaerolineae bacterium]|nr:hypothetical protein [Anaerolineae bacterium]
MRRSPLIYSLTLALVAALLMTGLIHLVTLDTLLAHAHREMSGAPLRDLGDGCCLFVCTSLIMGLLIATPALFSLRGRLSSSEPTTLAAILLPLDPPPRLAPASHRSRIA